MSFDMPWKTHQQKRFYVASPFLIDVLRNHPKPEAAALILQRATEEHLREESQRLTFVIGLLIRGCQHRPELKRSWEVVMPYIRPEHVMGVGVAGTQTPLLIEAICSQNTNAIQHLLTLAPEAAHMQWKNHTSASQLAQESPFEQVRAMFWPKAKRAQ